MIPESVRRMGFGISAYMAEGNSNGNLFHITPPKNGIINEILPDTTISCLLFYPELGDLAGPNLHAFF